MNSGRTLKIPWDPKRAWDPVNQFVGINHIILRCDNVDQFLVRYHFIRLTIATVKDVKFCISVGVGLTIVENLVGLHFLGFLTNGVGKTPRDKNSNYRRQATGHSYCANLGKCASPREEECMLFKQPCREQ